MTIWQTFAFLDLKFEREALANVPASAGRRRSHERPSRFSGPKPHCGRTHAIALRFLYLYANARQQTESRGADVSGTRLTIDRLALITTKMLVFDDAPTAIASSGRGLTRA